MSEAMVEGHEMNHFNVASLHLQVFIFGTTRLTPISAGSIQAFR